MNRPYTRAQGLADLLRQRILVLDGAMGTMIQRFKLSEAQYRGERFADFHKDVQGNNELLSLTRADIIRDIHEGYLAAGADLIETNTFGATTVAQDDYQMAHLVREMNLASAQLARAACDKFSTPDKPRFACGALGPTPRTASIRHRPGSSTHASAAGRTPIRRRLHSQASAAHSSSVAVITKSIRPVPLKTVCIGSQAGQ